MKVRLFDYNLPKELIAQKQIKPRDHSRLLIVDRKSRKIEHAHFFELPKYLQSGDVLVFNNSKVFPARIRFDQGRKEIFLLKDLGAGRWEAMGRKLEKNVQDTRYNFQINSKLKYQIIKKLDDGHWEIKFNLQGNKFREWLEKYGETPLPPYIKVKDSKKIRADYQTIFAKNEGSVAAPTAGLHFTKRILRELKKKGIKMEFVTLHVGAGTFQPVKTENIEEHKLHEEFVVLDKATAKRLNQYKKEGRRIIAVGTTSCRTLEAVSKLSKISEVSKISKSSKNEYKVAAGSRWVNIFIYPGYKFKFVDGLITNFHLPKSSLLMLVSALAGRKFILDTYQLAVKKKYRFYSFGDGMLIK
ncbi:tRNA preQ1(34) S-adenosylmethionine ribosyltransferase-isomerase QueA [Candidatus Kuenenbacteria bacterium]|nr:tRNA preQ1(34) S-adenosylmethionine ribosyltransferase-isomerase QueA [Candidatus Kuenenbacteria bacterium]